jgi:hypothetical protein
MSDINQFHDQVFDEFTPKKQMPTLLNVLTILTFIGCGLSYIGGLFNYFMGCKSLKMIQENPDLTESNPFVGKMTPEEINSLQNACEQRLPLLITILIFTSLCLAGAIMMRKLKKTGYYLYIVGTICPIIISYFLVGVGKMNVWTIIVYAVTLAFLILYGSMLKKMK